MALKLVNTTIVGTAPARDKRVREWRKKYPKVTVVRHRTSVTQRGSLYGPYWYEVNAWE